MCGVILVAVSACCAVNAERMAIDVNIVDFSVNDYEKSNAPSWYNSSTFIMLAKQAAAHKGISCDKTTVRNVDIWIEDDGKEDKVIVLFYLRHDDAHYEVRIYKDKRVLSQGWVGVLF